MANQTAWAEVSAQGMLYELRDGMTVVSPLEDRNLVESLNRSIGLFVSGLSPSDGEPRVVAAEELARLVGGRVDYVRLPKEKDGVIY